MSMEKEGKENFNSHLKRIRSARETTTSLIEQTTLAERSIGLLWEHLFDRLCLKTEEPDWQDVRDLSNILRKTTQSYHQLKCLELKTQNDQTEGEKDQKAWLLSEQTLADIEEQLQLL